MSLKLFFKLSLVIGLLGVLEGIYGVKSAHVHVIPHAPDIWDCLGSTGQAVITLAIVLVIASIIGLLKLSSRKLSAICLALSIITVSAILLENILFVNSVLHGRCDGNYGLSLVPLSQE